VGDSDLPGRHPTHAAHPPECATPPGHGPGPGPHL